MIFANRVTSVGALVLGSAMIGCGGSSTGTGVSGKLTPKVTINWPSLSKNFGAPKFAASAVITLTPASDPSKKVTWSVDRPSGSDESTNTYEGPELSSAGLATVLIDFTGQTGGRGGSVATAGVSGSVSSNGTINKTDGSPLGSVGFSSEIQSISVGSAIVYTNSTVQLLIGGFNARGGFVALPIDSVKFDILNGSEFGTIVGNQLTGNKEGDMTVRVSSGGVIGQNNFRIHPQLVTTRNLARNPNAVAVSPVSGKLFGVFGASATPANSFAEIDLTTGALTNVVAVGSEPDQIAVSNDGSVAWMGVRGSGGIRSLDLGTMTLGSILNVDLALGSFVTSGFAQDIAINPENSSEVAVSVRDSQSDFSWGPIIVRNGAKLPTFSTTDSTWIAYASGSNIVGIDGNTTGRGANRHVVNETGSNLDFSRTDVTRFGGSGDMVVKGENAVCADGSVFSTSSFEPVATIERQEVTPSLVAVDNLTNRAWFFFPSSDSFNGSTGGYIRCYELTNFTNIASSTVLFTSNDEAPKKLLRAGAKGGVLVTSKSTYAIDRMPGL